MIMKSKIKQQRLPLGVSDFRKLRERNDYYMDKSDFIDEIIDSSAEVILLPRPRRFGKTLNMSMLQCFFEKCDEDRTWLFDGLKIRDRDCFKTHQGRYPVISFTFKDLKELSYESFSRKMKDLVQLEFERHDRILQSDKITRIEKRFFESVLNDTAHPEKYSNALFYLSRCLNRFYDKKTIILIDEYDTPLNAGYLYGYYQEVVNFIRNFLSAGLKDNPNVFKGVITGILRIAKESIFSGFNNPGVYTLLDRKFSEYFGFSEDDVKDLLSAYDMLDRYDEVSHWYNGYKFGDLVIYNPWSVIGYLDNHGQAKPYWINTADTTMIERLVTREGRELKMELDKLLEGKTIEKPIYESIVMRDLDKLSDLLWSFLLFSGYLKPVRKTDDDDSWELTVPNHEVMYIYRTLVKKWFTGKVEHNLLMEMIQALEASDMNLFERLLRKIVTEIMSFHDLAGEPEKVYHAMVLGMLTWMSGKYDIRSNRESGYGRFDIMMKPKDIKAQGIIIEFKKIETKSEDAYKEVLEDALGQIEKRGYASELEAVGITDILKIAVAFRGKELWLTSE